MALIAPPLPAVSRPSNITTTRLPLCCSQRAIATSSSCSGSSCSFVVLALELAHCLLPASRAGFGRSGGCMLRATSSSAPCCLRVERAIGGEQVVLALGAGGIEGAGEFGQQRAGGHAEGARQRVELVLARHLLARSHALTVATPARGIAVAMSAVVRPRALASRRRVVAMSGMSITPSLLEARTQRGEVAGFGARVELRADDLLPRGAAGRGRAGQANTNVPLASPANARDCSDEVPISSKLIARNSSPKPGISLSSSGSSASGVESRPVKPVPPVTSTPSTLSSAIHCDTMRAQLVTVVGQQGAFGRRVPRFGRARRRGSRRSCLRPACASPTR